MGAQVPRQRGGNLAAGGRGVAGADDGDGGAGEGVGRAAHGQHRRRGGAVAEPGRIGRFAHGNEAAAERRRAGNLGFDLCLVGHRHAATAAAAGEIGKGAKGGAGGAELVDQLAEGDRADPFASIKAQPGQPLTIGKRNAGARRRPPAVRRGEGGMAGPAHGMPLMACRSGFRCPPAGAGYWHDDAPTGGPPGQQRARHTGVGRRRGTGSVWRRWRPGRTVRRTG